MRLPLLIFGLIYLATLLAYTLIQRQKPHSSKPVTANESTGGTSLRHRATEILSDTQRCFLLLAVAAILSLSFGKPDLGPQYVAWALIGVQVIKMGAIFGEIKSLVFSLRVLSYLLLGYLLIGLLPFFDPIPE